MNPVFRWLSAQIRAAVFEKQEGFIHRRPDRAVAHHMGCFAFLRYDICDRFCLAKFPGKGELCGGRMIVANQPGTAHWTACPASRLNANKISNAWMRGPLIIRHYSNGASHCDPSEDQRSPAAIVDSFTIAVKPRRDKSRKVKSSEARLISAVMSPVFPMLDSIQGRCMVLKV